MATSIGGILSPLEKAILDDKLVRAYEQKNVDAIVELIEKCQDKKYALNNNLYWACLISPFEVVLPLLSDINTDLSWKNLNMGNTSLLHAAACGVDSNTVKYLIDKDLSVNTTDDFGRTPLHLASANGQSQTILLLLEQGAKIDSKDMRGNTPLHIAALMDRKDSLECLINFGADTTLLTRFQQTALDLAELENKSECICILKDAQIGMTPMHRAAFEGCSDVVQQLVKSGGNVLATNKYGKTPLDLAEQEERLECISILREALKKEIVDSTSKETGIQKHQEESSKEVKANDRYESKTDYEILNDRLRDAYILGNLSSVEKLTEEFSDQKHAKNNRLFWACEYGTINEIDSLFLHEDIDVNWTNPNWLYRSFLHGAAATGNAKCVELLIKKGINVDCKDKYGKTPLELAELEEKSECIQLLQNALSKQAPSEPLTDIPESSSELTEVQANDTASVHHPIITLERPKTSKDKPEKDIPHLRLLRSQTLPSRGKRPNSWHSAYTSKDTGPLKKSDTTTGFEKTENIEQIDVNPSTKPESKESIQEIDVEPNNKPTNSQCKESIQDKKYKRILDTLCNRKCNANGIAFVVGISGPQGVELDTKNMSSTFQELNFAVLLQNDLTYTELVSLVTVATKMTYPLNYKCIVFYFAGHGGVDDNGYSYVLPLQVEETQEAEKLYIEKGIVSHFWTETTPELKYRSRIFLFDCCLSTQSSRADPQKPTKKPKKFNLEARGSCLIAYATSRKYKSEGDEVRGGLWTHYLHQNLKLDLPISTILDRTHDDVINDCRGTDNVQEPHYESCIGEFFLKGSSSQQKLMQTLTNIPVPTEPEPETDYHNPQGDHRRTIILNKSPKRTDVYNLLKKQSSLYDDFARELNIGDELRDKLNSNKTSHNNAKLEDVLKNWITDTTCSVTWAKVLEILDDLQLEDVAEEVKQFLDKEETVKKYIQ